MGRTYWTIELVVFTFVTMYLDLIVPLSHFLSRHLIQFPSDMPLNSLPSLHQSLLLWEAFLESLAQMWGFFEGMNYT